MKPRLLIALPLISVAATCAGQEPNGALEQGTWGGDNAAAIVTDSLHIHIGCTNGYAERPVLTAGVFEVPGRYNITAHPVDLGVFHPARVSGRVSGKTMTFTVTLTDTAVTLGPATVELGREPKMNPCPICRVPAAKPWWLPRWLRASPLSRTGA